MVIKFSKKNKKKTRGKKLKLKKKKKSENETVVYLFGFSQLLNNILKNLSKYLYKERSLSITEISDEYRTSLLKVENDSLITKCEYVFTITVPFKPAN